MTAPRRRPRPVTRREFIQRMAAVSAVAATARHWTPAQREAWARTVGSVARPEGTTLERFIWFDGFEGEFTRPGAYTPLRVYDPGWPIEVRADLAEPKQGREDRRVALAAFLHVTDYQFPDAQSPARVEFLARYADEPTPSFLSSAQRPQEALVVHACEAVHRRIRSLQVAPVTGRRLDFAIATGDNYDNKQRNELEWFITLMDGGTLTANSGDPDAVESVQTFGGLAYDDWYYHPDPDIEKPPLAPDRDHFKRNYGYPDYPGVLEAAIRPFDAVGVGVPWYSTYGNHDSLVQGNERVNRLYEDIAVGGEKILHPTHGIPAPGQFWRGFMEGDPDAVALYLSFPREEVTPDEDRTFIHDRDYIRAHLESAGQPTGHGYTDWHVDNAYLFYTFDIAPSVLGISLDTCAPIISEGAIGAAQLRWLEEQLVAVHSRHYDEDGDEVRTGNDDRLVLLFGHHRFDSILPNQNPRQIGKADEDDAPDAFASSDGYLYRIEQHHGGDELLALLHRFPNVVAYVNGHSHFNRAGAHPAPNGRAGGLWEITTSAQLDPPQHARVVELADNRDGTVSIFATLVDHAGPAQTQGSYDVLDIAAISRELGFNDYQAGVENKVGAVTDRNVELIVPAPFALTATPERPEPPVATPPPAEPPGRALPATGAGAVAGLGLAALGAAAALRQRGAR